AMTPRRQLLGTVPSICRRGHRVGKGEVRGDGHAHEVGFVIVTHSRPRAYAADLVRTGSCARGRHSSRIIVTPRSAITTMDDMSEANTMLPTHESLIADWKQNAERDGEANFRFLRSLKMVREERVDAVAHELHRQVFSIIDCTRCAHCCKTMAPHLDD